MPERLYHELNDKERYDLTQAHIRKMVEEERRACAALAVAIAKRNEYCPKGCRCADGYHIAAAILRRGEEKAP